MLTIAVLDDQETWRDNLYWWAKQTLSGGEVIKFSQPEELKRYIKEGKSFDVLVVDFEMPLSTLNGADVAIMVREHTKYQEIKPVIILCSSLAQEKQNAQLFDFYIDKRDAYPAAIEIFKIAARSVDAIRSSPAGKPSLRS